MKKSAAMPARSQVARSTTPVTGRCALRWNARIASVVAPLFHSTSVGATPRRRWTSATREPLYPTSIGRHDGTGGCQDSGRSHGPVS